MSKDNRAALERTNAPAFVEPLHVTAQISAIATVY